jgi:hypothetical protein
VTARSLGDRIIQDLEEYKNVDLVQKFDLKKYRFESSEAFEISPYVIFGEDFKTRIQSANLWEDIRPISSNRFIKMDAKLGMM